MAEAQDAPIVLVTGASGFIATHIVHQLLTAGNVRVRGTVRNLGNEAKVAPLREMVPDAAYPLELVEADLTDEESWKEAVKGCSYVYHVASPLPPAVPTNPDEVLVPAVNGAVNVLKACAQSGTVKRVVLTSSVAAVSGGLFGRTDHIYTEEDWAEEEGLPPYELSKLRAERAAWDFHNKLEDENKFELVTVQPGVVIGPPLAVAAGESTSLSVVKKLLSNEIPVVINLNLFLVDVRDVAAGHIAAMNKPGISGSRYLLSGENRWIQEIAQTISNEFTPQGYKIASWRMPKVGLWLYSFFDASIKLIYPMLGKVITISNEKMRNELGIVPRNTEASILETCYTLIELGIVEKKGRYQGPPTATPSVQLPGDQVTPPGNNMPENPSGDSPSEATENRNDGEKAPDESEETLDEATDITSGDVPPDNTASDKAPNTDSEAPTEQVAPDDTNDNKDRGE